MLKTEISDAWWLLFLIIYCLVTNCSLSQAPKKSPLSIKRNKIRFIPMWDTEWGCLVWKMSNTIKTLLLWLKYWQIPPEGKHIRKNSDCLSVYVTRLSRLITQGKSTDLLYYASIRQTENITISEEKETLVLIAYLHHFLEQYTKCWINVFQ